MKSALKILSTGKDNETLDIARIAMVVVTLSLPLVMLWGIGLQTYCTITGKTFDIQAFFTGIGIFLGMFGTFLMGGAASLFFKKTTEADGSDSTTTKTEFTQVKKEETSNG